jgi:hypothetical protein
LRVPNVPAESRLPVLSRIWLAKKFVGGLRGPWTLFALTLSGAVGPNSIESPVVPGSPSMALTASRPESGPDGGVQNPLTDAAALPCVPFSKPRKSERLRIGCAKSS